MRCKTTSKTKLTPREIAQQWGIAPEKVIGWIRAGELRAINAATRMGGQPRYLVDVADLADFELGRQAGPDRPKKAPRRRRAEPGLVFRFFPVV